jgi:hypothetical protein
MYGWQRHAAGLRCRRQTEEEQHEASRLEFLRATMRSVAVAKAAEPFSRELRDDLEYEEQLLAALITEAEEQWGFPRIRHLKNSTK